MNPLQELAIALIQNDVGDITKKHHFVQVEFYDSYSHHHSYEISESDDCDGLYNIAEPFENESGDIDWIIVEGYTTLESTVSFINARS